MNASSRNASLAGALSLLFFFACVSTSFNPAESYGARNLLPVAPADVRVLTSPPSEAFNTLGEIQADISGYQSNDAVIRKVRERAAAVGADAVIIGNTLFADAPVLEGAVTTYPRPVSITFIAIRFTPADSSQPHP